MANWSIRHEWIERVPGLEVQGTRDQHLVTYEPGDATHYEVSFSPAPFTSFCRHLACGSLPYWQFSVWTGSGRGPGTMLVEAGESGTCIADLERIQGDLRCSTYSAQVFSILVHGCLFSHDINVAREGIAHFRSAGRNGFVDPDAA